MGLSESKSLTKEHTPAKFRHPHEYVADVQLCLYVDPKQMDQGLSQKLLTVRGIYSSSWPALFGFSGRERPYAHRYLKFQGKKIPTAQRRIKEEMKKGLKKGVTWIQAVNSM